MRLSRHLHLRLDDQLLSELAAYSAANGVGAGPAVRLLLAHGLHAAEAERNSTTESIALAALVAAEHAVLMVASILPEGESRMMSLTARAAEAAERRLASLTETVEQKQ